MEYIGEVIDPLDFHNRTQKYSKEKIEHHYFMALKSDEIIDATVKGNITRFVNHSCDPNSETQKVSRNQFFAFIYSITSSVDSQWRTSYRIFYAAIGSGGRRNHF